MMLEIECFECGGQGWAVIYGWHGLPEQDRCGVCNGNKKLTITEQQYNDLKDNDVVVRLIDDADQDKYQVRW